MSSNLYRLIYGVLQRLVMWGVLPESVIAYGLALRAYKKDLIVRFSPGQLENHANDLFIKSIPPFLCSGDWDTNVFPVKQVGRYQRVESIVQSLPEFRNCTEYKRYITALENNEPITRHEIALDSVESIDQYFENIANIYTDIKENGYKGASELGGAEGDVCIGIGREGDLIHLQTGHHRVAMAQLSETPFMIGKIMVVHPEFVKKKGTLIKAIRSVTLD